ncbi:MAG: RNA-binding S4 domain-containing protein [Tissierellia bacterium]|nr:RNA-binding S4 domain-containing protein [Tissierellia bacterium]
MRIDKFLKNARIIKRRTVAKEACDQGRVLINEKLGKAGDEVKIGDVVQINFGSGSMKFKVLDIKENLKKEDATTLYEIIE